MAVFVILSLALLTMSLGLVLVAAGQLLKAGRRFRDAATASQSRVTPLLQELQEEAAVTALETEALQARMARLSARTPRRMPRRA